MEITEQVRQAANIIEIASQYTALRQRGRKHVGLCPFHSEKTPSFTVDADKQLYHCFGCGVGGDVFSLVMEKENLSFPEALRHLAERYHIPVPDQKKLSPQALKLEEQILKVNEAALAFFRKNLHGTDEGRKALDYLKKREIPDALLAEFKVGYAINAWDSLTGHFKAKGVSPALLEKAGLVLPGRKPGEYYDRFRGRVIFPILNMTGKVIGFGGRTIVNAEPKYLNSPDTPVYTKGLHLYGLNASKDAIREAGEAILAEGYTDYLSIAQAGHRNVVASLGTALTPQQIGLAMRFAPRLVINYDGDEAGQKAAFRALPLCWERGVETRVVVLPENLDPDGYIKKHGTEAYAARLKEAAPGLRFFLEYASRGQRMNVPEVKSRVLKGILSVLDAIPDPVLRSEYLKETAETLGLDESVLRRLSQPKAASGPAPQVTELLYAERRLLQILLEGPGLRADVFAEVQEDDFRGLKSEPVFKIILDRFSKDKEILLNDLQKEVDPALFRELSRCLLEKGEPPGVPEALECLNALRKMSTESELKRIQTEIQRAAKADEKSLLAGLLRRKQDLTKQICPSPSRKA